MSWNRSSVARDGTHHELDGHPMYSRRFRQVQKFHAPGLAPVVDPSGAYHVRPDGEAAYGRRFFETWGYYDGLAAARDGGGCLHVHPDGAPLSDRRYAWCGNFQEERCAVREQDGSYLHLTASGDPAYRERYRYVGDFREGRAVVHCRRRDLCTHVARDGSPVHGRWYLDLDVYHKGFARARDAVGWMHVDAAGAPSYGLRFAELEPFYNGSALARTLDGRRVLIDHDGREVLEIR